MALPPNRDAPREMGGAREASWFDPLVLLFGLWTLVANAVVFSAGGLRSLVFIGLPLVLLAGVFLWRGRNQEALALAVEPVQARNAGSVAPWERIFVLVLSLLALCCFLFGGDVLLLWSMAAMLSIWCLWRSMPLPLATTLARTGRLERLGLWGMALFCLGLTLFAHRADFDDAFYINLAVQAADHPQAALLVEDGMHGIEGLPLSLSVYRIQSYELLAGAIAWLTPLEALGVMHVLFPALVSLAIPFGLALLLRRLIPRGWLLAVLFALLFLFASGDPHRSFGNFSFMRLQQGKAVLLSLMLPLVSAYGLRFAARPSLRTWWLLAAAQVAALGTNVTALWLAPSCAMLAVAAGLPWARKSLRPLLFGLLSCAYPLGAALLLSRSTASNLEASGLLVEPAVGLAYAPLAILLLVVLVGLVLSVSTSERRRSFARGSAFLLGGCCLGVVFLDPRSLAAWFGVEPGGGERFSSSLQEVLGPGPQAALFLLAMMSAWCVAESGLARRLWAFFGAAFLLFFWNPMLAESLAGKVTGGPTYWRVFWVLPAAAWTGFGASGLVQLMRRVGPQGPALRWLCPSALGVGLAAGLIFLPGHSSLSAKNQVFFARPGLRARQMELDAARSLAQGAGAGTQVLAPVRVSPWIPTMHAHPFPLMVRRPYMKNLDGYLQPSDIKERAALTRLVSGSDAKGKGGLRGAELQRLLRGIETYGLRGVCLAVSCVGVPLREALGAIGMRSVSSSKRYQVWVQG